MWLGERNAPEVVGVGDAALCGELFEQVSEAFVAQAECLT
jgi:hypothetical protein